ncbi:uncharacterized protein LOC106661962 isoform X2 [Cimex lectularius]|uniref:tRNA-splicing endonuclease subunit Sen15 domain-containing protein n=1 Tax=Cimex lectularius TaxID=79782 RepID=A0A8I6TD97_CIMLE|nr:uncharacterized protein LOC106661962 isoform X2 [Cimex lectularius]
MSLAHPILKEMLNSGCSDHTNILIAFQTYMELCEVHNFETVEHCFSMDMNMIYLKAVEDKEEEIFLPISIKENITPSWIEKVRQAICQNENGEVQKNF